MAAKKAFMARTTAGKDHLNTLDLRLEERHVFHAQGLQFHNDQMPASLKVPEVLADPSSGYGTMRSKEALDVIVHDENEFEYDNHDQGVRYKVHRILTRTKLKEALETPDAHVVYAGHARFGRGPCFGRGTKDTKGEQWEDGTSPETGIFRMGYPFLGIPLSDIEHHGYTANLAAADVPLGASDCDPDLRPHLGRLEKKTAEEIHPALLDHAREPDPSKKWWTYHAYESGVLAPHLVLHAGWEETTVDPLDLGAIDPRARVFCHFGCSTMKHNQPVMRDLKGWQRSSDHHHAYFTTNLSYGIETVLYFYHLLSYPEPSRGRPWKAGLDYTVRKTNADLGASGLQYRII